MESIARLMEELPKDYETDSRTQGAFTSARGIKTPSDLMKLSIFHLHNESSLMEISEVARMTELGQVSDVAFMNRLAKCGDWFRSINEKIAAQSLIEYKKPKWMEGMTVVALDVSDVKEGGRSQKLYRLHYAIDIFKMSRVEYKITTNEVGESLCNFSPQPNHLQIGDRAYTTINGLEHCAAAGASYIMRLRKNSFTIRDENGEKLDMLALFATLKTEECLDISAYATNAKGKKIPIRVCAKRKTPQAIEETQKKLKRKEQTRQRKMLEETKTYNEYIIVVTNLDENIPAKEILEAYRLRWQIEIYFKRLKSILGCGVLPKRREDSALAWFNGKLMIALLIETVIAKASFSPQGYGE